MYYIKILKVKKPMKRQGIDGEEGCKKDQLNLVTK